MLLSKNQRFIEEYKSFNDKIGRISNDKVKNECLALLRELTTLVQEIDKHHADIGITVKMPTSVGDTRDSIQSIRKKLTAKLKDCDQANLIK
jgi:hypothetical protein